ncbi:divalent-cation tolerance protein CutA [Micromonospora sp. NPDC049374]|uniref:divalent-cation tolerance protein CutA n=1 Tax=Micromonospora sp. NPDC049374 TaxID=3154352 RepID=UPI00341D46CB
MEQISVVTTVVDARSVADLLAAAAVAGRLAACAQVGGQVDSTYWWRSGVETSTEWSVQFKTAPDRVDALVEQLRASHPYEVPEILVTRVDCGHPEYAAWVFEHTRT